MKRKKYESPQTLIAEVEVESSFCGSVINNDENSEANTTSQEVLNKGTDGKEWDFGSDAWK